MMPANRPWRKDLNPKNRLRLWMKISLVAFVTAFVWIPYEINERQEAAEAKEWEEGKAGRIGDAKVTYYNRTKEWEEWVEKFRQLEQNVHLQGPEYIYDTSWDDRTFERVKSEGLSLSKGLYMEDFESVDPEFNRIVKETSEALKMYHKELETVEYLQLVAYHNAPESLRQDGTYLTWDEDPEVAAAREKFNMSTVEYYQRYD